MLSPLVAVVGRCCSLSSLRPPMKHLYGSPLRTLFAAAWDMYTSIGRLSTAIIPLLFPMRRGFSGATCRSNNASTAGAVVRSHQTSAVPPTPGNIVPSKHCCRHQRLLSIPTGDEGISVMANIKVKHSSCH